MSYTASAINLRVDAPGRKDRAEELEAADVHALMSESMGNIGKPDAKARGRKGRLDWEHSVGTPPASWERPRADSVRIVEHAPVCQLAVESFKNPVSKVRREAISKPNTEVRYAKFEGQAIIHETSALHAALIPTGIQVTRARIRRKNNCSFKGLCIGVN